MVDFSVLDNPVWSALATDHAPLARISGLARRYPSDMSPLTGLAESSSQALADLLPLALPADRLALFTPGPLDISSEWETFRTLWLDQMVCTNPAPSPSAPLLRLGEADVPEMLALTAATEPGPFLPRTIGMGPYFGIRSPDGALAAMAGIRLQPRGFREISAVCTAPHFRGRGHAGALIASLAQQILASGNLPFLHVKQDNPAKHLYRKLGFVDRQPVHLTGIVPRPAATLAR